MSFSPGGRHSLVRSGETIETQPELVAAATAGDETAFGELVERHRRELHVHCYRLLGSFEDAEDLVQETFLRAWRKRASFEGRSTFRAWLYRIATNACLDALERRPRVVPPHAGGQPVAEVPWLQPYPDQLLDGVAPSDEEPEAEVVARETIELAFIAAIQLLPPRQRVVLIAGDVLGWSAAESAALLDVSVAAVNSANRQPALAAYVRRSGDSQYRAFAIDVLRVEDGLIADVIAFRPDVFPAFGLPPEL
jgi:RNA polymerase sigma-70 factor, ECF subfamily